MRNDDVPPPYAIIPKPVTPNLVVSLVPDPETHDLLISIVPPKEPLSEAGLPATRSAVDICCVIDVSGSMGEELRATLEEGQAAENTGLSTLDVVKHAVNTIVATMQPDDRISVVTFSTTAKAIVGLTHMTAAGKAQVLEAVEKLHPLDSTNLWDGLKTGMNILNGLAAIPNSVVSPGDISASRMRTLFLLTDGMPNINPPRGIIKALQSYIDSNPLNFSIHTFGFGYSLDSQLLLQIARLGSGAFGFIPDATSLGAVFIHAVANLYSVCADKVELSIEYPGSGSTGTDGELDIYDCPGATLCSWGVKIEVGNVQYGQTRDFVVKMKNYPQLSVSPGGAVLSATVNYRPWTEGARDKPKFCTVLLTPEAITNGTSEDALVNLKSHVQRFSFLRAVDGLFNPSLTLTPALQASRAGTGSNTSADSLRDTVTHEFKSILSPLQSPPLASHPPASALGKDIDGECLLALSSHQVYTRWGKHYLPSLARLHLLQQCGSFRDPGLQVYGAESPLFTSSRDALEKAFDSIPPPKPSIRAYSYPGAGYAMGGAPGGAPGGRGSFSSIGGGGGGRQGSSRMAPLAAASCAPQAEGNAPPPPPPAPKSMSSRFARRSGPCFDGTCEITLADDRKIPVKDLRRGFDVKTPRGLRRVLAVIKTHVEDGTALLCELPGGLKITPWHPIKDMSTRWVFPASHTTPKLRACDAIYSLLLEPDVDPDAHSVYIKDVLCVTLGHGITHLPSDLSGDDIRAHPFLGHYQSIVHTLALFPRADEGVYHVSGTIRDVKTGMICGFIPHNDVDGSKVFTGQLGLNDIVKVEA